MAKAVLNRVVSNLKSKNLFDAYNRVFEEQLSEGIIEELVLGDINVEDHVWIPQRPIIKSDARSMHHQNPPCFEL